MSRARNLIRAGILERVAIHGFRPAATSIHLDDIKKVVAAPSYPYGASVNADRAADATPFARGQAGYFACISL